MITNLAFVAYPTRDARASRDFYETVLGLSLTHSWKDVWFEYDLGDATFVIAKADDEHPTPARGAMVAFEVADLDETVSRLESKGVALEKGITTTPVCRMAVVVDPDGNELILHQRTAA